MFIDNLSTSVSQQCGLCKLSYEAAFERCNISLRYFGDIARGRTAPTILTMEKRCSGFRCSPDELLLASRIPSEMAFRRPMQVREISCYEGYTGIVGFPVCPRCATTLEREYQSFCDRCGQCLDWGKLEHAQVSWSR